LDDTETAETAEITNSVDNSYGSSHGKPSLGIDIAYVRAVLALFIAGASHLRTKKIVNVSILENPITYLLDEEMRAIQRANKSDIIRWIVQPNIKRDPNDPLLRCEPDFVFLWLDEETDPDLVFIAGQRGYFEKVH